MKKTTRSVVESARQMAENPLALALARAGATADIAHPAFRCLSKVREAERIAAEDAEARATRLEERRKALEAEANKAGAA